MDTTQQTHPGPRSSEQDGSNGAARGSSPSTTDASSSTAGGSGAGQPGMGSGQRPAGSRFDAFATLAKRRAAGELVFLPRMLKGRERQLHVRQTLREDHEQRIHKNRDAALAKFDKLAGSVYSFFRGTCLLFYRDMAGEDAWMPTVLTLGDVHPENFGVMPSVDNTPIFGVNDFDEAYYAPFTWDLKRGGVGFSVAARAHGMKKKAVRKIVRCLLAGYFAGIEDFAKDQSERHYQVRLDNAPPLIRELLAGAQRDREEWLCKYLDTKRGRFAASDELVPLSSEVAHFQKLIDEYAKTVRVPPRAANMTVKDVAEKKGSGTASLGLPRYYVLIEGVSADGTDDLIIEMKRARRSALAGLAPPSQYECGGEADRVVNAQAVHLVGGDPFYGKVELHGESFLVRERSPLKREIKLKDLSKSDWKAYAHCCGRSLAQSHALADETGALEGDVEALILEAAGQRELFIDDLVQFVEEGVKRVYIDHEAFIDDHRRGAFRSIDRVFE